MPPGTAFGRLADDPGKIVPSTRARNGHLELERIGLYLRPRYRGVASVQTRVARAPLTHNKAKCALAVEKLTSAVRAACRPGNQPAMVICSGTLGGSTIDLARALSRRIAVTLGIERESD